MPWQLVPSGLQPPSPPVLQVASTWGEVAVELKLVEPDPRHQLDEGQDSEQVEGDPLGLRYPRRI